MRRWWEGWEGGSFLATRWLHSDTIEVYVYIASLMGMYSVHGHCHWAPGPAECCSVNALPLLPPLPSQSPRPHTSMSERNSPRPGGPSPARAAEDPARPRYLRHSRYIEEERRTEKTGGHGRPELDDHGAEPRAPPCSPASHSSHPFPLTSHLRKGVSYAPRCSWKDERRRDVSVESFGAKGRFRRVAGHLALPPSVIVSFTGWEGQRWTAFSAVPM